MFLRSVERPTKRRGYSEAEKTFVLVCSGILDNENEKYRELRAYLADSDAGDFEAGETREARDALDFEGVVREVVD